jgi:hypothetical protein
VILTTVVLSVQISQGTVLGQVVKEKGADLELWVAYRHSIRTRAALPSALRATNMIRYMNNSETCWPKFLIKSMDDLMSKL